MILNKILLKKKGFLGDANPEKSSLRFSGGDTLIYVVDLGAKKLEIFNKKRKEVKFSTSFESIYKDYGLRFAVSMNNAGDSLNVVGAHRTL